MRHLRLYDRDYKINDDIILTIPTVGQILDDDSFYTVASLVTSTPTDMMAQLDEAGYDFTEVTDWDLFLMLFEELKNEDCPLLFKDIKYSDFIIAKNNSTGEMVLWNQEKDIMIDRIIHDEICDFLRNILGFEKNEKHPANQEAKDYLIYLAKKKLKRQMRRKNAQETPSDQIEKFIVALVCSPEMNYTFDTIRDLTIYQFNTALHQTLHRVEFDKLMIGCYAGTVDMKGVEQSKLNWIML